MDICQTFFPSCFVLEDLINTKSTGIEQQQLPTSWLSGCRRRHKDSIICLHTDSMNSLIAWSIDLQTADNQSSKEKEENLFLLWDVLVCLWW